MGHAIGQLIEIAQKEPKHIIGSFMKLDVSKIETIRFWTMVEYELYLGIYRAGKSIFESELDAFSQLWLAELIEIEEWYDAEWLHDADTPKSLFQNFFLKEVRDYRVKPLEAQWAEAFTNACIEDKLQKVINGRKKEREDGHQDNIGGAGIYTQNHRRLDEATFDLWIQGLIKATQIRHDDSYAGYRTLFLETNTDYILFTE